LPAGDAALIRVAAVLLMLVFAIKGALVPLHFWLPGTYAHAPGPVAALFAVMTKVGAYAVIRVGTLIFPPATPAMGTLIADLLGPAAIATLALGAIGVLGAVSLQRMVAFAAIASMGTVFIAVAQFTPQATAAALYYTVHSTFAAAILFLVADQVSARRANDSLQTTLPPMAQSGLLAVLFFTGSIAMAGMPPLSGFVGKLLILDATRDGQMLLIWGAILTTSLIIILGFARAGSLLFWKSHASGAAQTGKAEPVALAVIIALISGLVALTVFAGPTMRYIAATAAGLHAPTAYVAAHHLGATP
ncbi:MAG: proton-conducting transporter membrane subunit, partial [Paracoccaceae bacterium]